MGNFTHVFSIMGWYKATWAGSDLGTTENGWSVEFTTMNEAIHCDDLGDALADAVQRGQAVRVVGRGLEWSLLKPALGLVNTPGDVTADLGQLVSTLADVLVLTPQNRVGDTGNVRKTKTFNLAYVENYTEPLNNRLATCDVVFTVLVDENGKLFTED
jgi:hypothetical protein